MTGMVKQIDSWMRHIWLRHVKKEYGNGRILGESNLHSTVYPAPRKLRPVDVVRGLLSFEKVNRKFGNQENETISIFRDAVL